MIEPALPQHTQHARRYAENRYVYPVLSRRSKGLSLGINLNPDKVCNFDCVYCQVNRRTEAESDFVDLAGVLREADDLLRSIVSGAIYRDPQFASVPAPLRRLNDLAFSGDGEPTTYRNFDEIVECVADLKRAHGLDETKLVLITNASMFHRATVQRGLELLDRHEGEIWAKLDAGTEEYYHLIERTRIPFRRILDNIGDAARIRPLVIQSLFMRIHDAPPASREIREYSRRLREIAAAGGKFKLIQIYTVARPPAETWVTPLFDDELDALAETVRHETGLPIETYYGTAGRRPAT